MRRASCHALADAHAAGEGRLPVVAVVHHEQVRQRRVPRRHGEEVELGHGHAHPTLGTADHHLLRSGADPECRGEDRQHRLDAVGWRDEHQGVGLARRVRGRGPPRGRRPSGRRPAWAGRTRPPPPPAPRPSRGTWSTEPPWAPGPESPWLGASNATTHRPRATQRLARGRRAAATSRPSRARGMPWGCPSRRRPDRGRCRAPTAPRTPRRRAASGPRVTSRAGGAGNLNHSRSASSPPSAGDRRSSSANSRRSEGETGRPVAGDGGASGGTVGQCRWGQRRWGQPQAACVRPSRRCARAVDAVVRLAAGLTAVGSEGAPVTGGPEVVETIDRAFFNRHEWYLLWGGDQLRMWSSRRSKASRARRSAAGSRSRRAEKL